MSVDNELFLWNYDLNQDVAFFDGIKNTILRMDLVKPKPGFFPPAVHFILVVATTLDVILLGASFTDAENRPITAGTNADYRTGAMYLLTNPLFQVPLEGALVNDIACTSDGRIFFAADECVNEICFTDTYIIGKGFKKVNHTKSLIHMFVPALGMFSSKDHIRQLVVDDTRHILYVLFMKGTVEIFDLGADGKSTKKAGRIVPEQIQDEISRCCDMEPEFYKQIVHITPIPATRSHYVYFEGTTSKGVRVYFTCLQTAPPNYPVQRAQSEVRPVTIRIVHIRFPPGNPSVFASRHVQVYAAHRADDLTFMATSAGDVETALWAFCSSNFAFYASYIESLILLPAKGTVWSLALDDDDNVLRPPVGSDLVPEIQPPRIVEQHMHPVDKVHVLTTEGVFTFNHLSPLENMRTILAQHSSESKQFQAFAALHAPVDICLMALNIICSDSYRDASIK
ncbi:Nucleoporin, partial [Aphelenchoides avenae]